MTSTKQLPQKNPTFLSQWAKVFEYISPLTLAILALILLRLPWLFALVERDEGVFGYVGFMFATGGTPYVDVVDHHGLSLYTLFATSYKLFGATVIPLRLFVLGLQVLCTFALYDLSKRWFGQRIAETTVILFALFSNIPVFESHYAMTEPLSTPFALFGVFVYERYRALKVRKPLLYLLAWFLIAFASSIRFTQAFMGIMLAVVITVDTLSETGVPLLKRIQYLFWRGFMAFSMVALVWGVIAVVLHYKGGLERFLQILQETFSYGTASAYIPLEMRIFILQQGIPMFALALVGFTALLLNYRKLERSHFVTLWWAIIMVWVVTRPQMLGHYFVQLVPVASLIAAIGFMALVGLSRRFVKEAWQSIALASVPLILLFIYSAPLMLAQYPNMHPPISGGRQSFNYADSMSYSDEIRLAQVVREQMAEARAENPEAQVFVFGNSPSTYWLSEEKAPVRDTYAINYYNWVVHEHNDPSPFAIARHRNTEVMVLFDLYIGDSLVDVTYYVTTQFELVEKIGGSIVYRRH